MCITVTVYACDYVCLFGGKKTSLSGCLQLQLRSNFSENSRPPDNPTFPKGNFTTAISQIPNIPMFWVRNWNERIPRYPHFPVFGFKISGFILRNIDIEYRTLLRVFSRQLRRFHAGVQIRGESGDAKKTIEQTKKN